MRSVRRILVSLALVFASAASPAWAGTVTLTPNHGPVGTSLTATGTGYHADHHIGVLGWGHTDASNPLATDVVDAAGRFRIVFTVPVDATTAQLRFWDVEGRFFDVASFTIDPTTPDTTTGHPPVITSTDTSTDGVMIWVNVHFADADDDASGFVFEGENGSSWGRTQLTFANPAVGRVTGHTLSYPFNHLCGTSSQYESDVGFWISDDTGLFSTEVVTHMKCAATSGDNGQKPVEQKPVEQKPVEQKPVEQKPVEQKPVEQKPVEQKPVEQKPVEQKPVEQKPKDETQTGAVVSVSLMSFEYDKTGEPTDFTGDPTTFAGAGATIVYVAKVTNTSNSSVTGVHATDELPAEIFQVTSGTTTAVRQPVLSDHGNCTSTGPISNVTVACDGVDLAAGETATVRFAASITGRNPNGTPTSPRDFANTVVVTADGRTGEARSRITTGIEEPTLDGSWEDFVKFVGPCFALASPLPLAGIFDEWVFHSGRELTGELTKEAYLRSLELAAERAGWDLAVGKIVDLGECAKGASDFWNSAKSVQVRTSTLTGSRPPVMVRSTAVGNASVTLVRDAGRPRYLTSAAGRHGRRVIFRAKFKVHRGLNVLRVHLPRKARHGRARLAVVVRSESGRRIGSARRTVKLRR